jgi:hypothetical protein
MTCEDNFSDPLQIARSIPTDVSATFKTSYDEIDHQMELNIERSYYHRDRRQCDILHKLPGNSQVTPAQCRFPRHENDENRPKGYGIQPAVSGTLWKMPVVQ